MRVLNLWLIHPIPDPNCLLVQGTADALKAEKVQARVGPCTQDEEIFGEKLLVHGMAVGLSRHFTARTIFNDPRLIGKEKSVFDKNDYLSAEFLESGWVQLTGARRCIFLPPTMIVYLEF